MLELQVEITGLVDDAQPGWVECRLVDAAGATHMFVEKVPIVSARALTGESSYPCAGSIACTLVDRVGDVVRVDTTTPYGVTSIAGAHVFTVHATRVRGVPPAR